MHIPPSLRVKLLHVIQTETRKSTIIESTAAALAAPHLEEGSTTVGTKLDVEHVAATPVGMDVTATATLVEIDRRRLVFEVEVTDKAGVIGRGRHERFIVASEKFMAKTVAKLEL